MKKTLGIGLAALVVSGAAFAQYATETPAAAMVETQQVVPVATTAESGNAFEKQVTPLLREISRKKSILELRKLDREIERIDEEAIKAKETLKEGVPNSMPNSYAQQYQQMQQPLMRQNDGVRVLMIYGFEDNLSAKIASGQQGGYVVRVGDVMPDGRVVKKITTNYVEVSKARKGKKGAGVDRLFVSPREVAPAQELQNFGGIPAGMVPVGGPGIR